MSDVYYLEFKLVTYPISTARDHYRGADANKRRKAQAFNQMSADIERYVNAQLEAQTDPVKVYFYHSIASATGYTDKQVYSACYSIEGGSGGITAVKQNMTAEERARALPGSA